MFTIWPLMVWTSVAQPTEQKGHTLGVTLALEIRNSCAFATTPERLTPDAISPPSAVPLPPAIEMRKTSRREISTQRPPSVVGCLRARKGTAVFGRKHPDGLQARVSIRGPRGCVWNAHVPEAQR